MTNSTHTVTDAERIAIERMGVVLPRDAASIARRPRTDATTRARKPLGLGIVPGDIDEPERDRSSYGVDRSDAYSGPQATAEKLVQASIANLSDEQLAQPVSMKDLFELGIEMALESSFETGDALRERIREQARGRCHANGTAHPVVG